MQQHCNRLYFSYFSIKTNVYNSTADSHLYLGMASAADSGTYSCNVADLASARLSIHILNGKAAKKIHLVRGAVKFMGKADAALENDHSGDPSTILGLQRPAAANFWISFDDLAT